MKPRHKFPGRKQSSRELASHWLILYNYPLLSDVDREQVIDSIDDMGGATAPNCHDGCADLAAERPAVGRGNKVGYETSKGSRLAAFFIAFTMF
jgi:hypothetical protein